MTSSFFQALPLEQQQLLDRLCDEFEQAWDAGQRPSIERFLEHFPAEHRPPLLLELVELEVQLRRQRSEDPTPSEYLSRFPEDGPALAALPCFAGQPAPDTKRDDILDRRAASTNQPLPPVTADQDARIGGAIGSYRVLEKLGQGGMGEVFRVAHLLIDCQRAMKTLNPQLAGRPAAMKRFLREAQASVRHLIHPHLVTVYDVGRDGDTVYLVMELVDGLDLAQLVEREGPLAPARAAELIRQAATGLQFAHERGYVHRDIKPHNIMVTSAGDVKILDLGLVRALDHPDEAPLAGPAKLGEPLDFQQSLTLLRTRLTDERALLGTLPYMSPEQAADPSQADVQSDIYSLGCTFYFLLTGKQAFCGATAEEVLCKHATGDFPPLLQVRPEAPEPLVDIVMRMLHRDRQHRYATAAEVQSAIEQWTTGRPARVRLKDADELRRGLVGLGLVSEDDWNTAVAWAQRPSRAWSNPEGRQAADMTLAIPSNDAHPAIILQKLQQLQSARGGQQCGLSEFQGRMVLNENADLLRLPQHILLDQIGGGWKGELYKARHLTSHCTETVRLLPVKSLLGLGWPSQQRLQRFDEHVAALRALDHPHLARIQGGQRFEHRVHGEMAVIAGEFIVGESLENFVNTRKQENGQPPTLGWFVEQWAAVARALDLVHAAGLLHLDITARSLRVDREHRLRLTDVGVAAMLREMPDLTETSVDVRANMAPSAQHSDRSLVARSAPQGTMTTRQLAPVGTPEVQAPELFRDPRAVSPAADLYSCGCCLFYSLTGAYPFTGEGATGAMLGHLTRSPWESPLAALAPPPLKPVLDGLLAKEPHHRLRSAAALAAALDDLLQSRRFPREAAVRWTAGSAATPQQSQAAPAAKGTPWLQRLWTSLTKSRSR